nr:zinc-binding dehydrogenase [Vibrio ichthyoenteri]
MAKYWNTEVYSTARGGEQGELVSQLGATAIDFTTESVADYVAKYTSGNGFDLIFDSVGGANLNNSIEAAKLNGQIATTVTLHEQDLSMIHMKGLSLHVVFMLIPMIHNVGRAEHHIILSELAKIVEAGGLTPIVDVERYNLADVSGAHKRLASGQAIGKVVIDIE